MIHPELVPLVLSNHRSTVLCAQIIIILCILVTQLATRVRVIWQVDELKGKKNIVLNIQVIKSFIRQLGI